MGWAERANPNSEYNKKRHPVTPPSLPRIEKEPKEKRLTFWQKIKGVKNAATSYS